MLATGREPCSISEKKRKARRLQPRQALLPDASCRWHPDCNRWQTSGQSLPRHTDERPASLQWAGFRMGRHCPADYHHEHKAHLHDYVSVVCDVTALRVFDSWNTTAIGVTADKPGSLGRTVTPCTSASTPSRHSIARHHASKGNHVFARGPLAISARLS